MHLIDVAVTGRNQTLFLFLVDRQIKGIQITYIHTYMYRNELIVMINVFCNGWCWVR